MNKVPLGITVVDSYRDEWAYWQVSVSTFNGPATTVATNAVTSMGFDKTAFRSLSWNRPVLVSARAHRAYDNSAVEDAEHVNMAELLEQAYSWTNYLQNLFWRENDRRTDANRKALNSRKEARHRGETVPAKYQRLGTLQDIDWPAPPPASLWASDPNSTAEPREEALRLARGCIQLLDYWLEVERERTKKTRRYFSDTGGPEIRTWPVPVPEGASN